MKNKISIILIVTAFNLISCKPEPAVVYSYFKIYNDSEHYVLLKYYDKIGEEYLKTDIENNAKYEMVYNNTYSCCVSCFLSLSDSVVFYFDDTIKMVHFIYDLNKPSHNIYNSLYFVQANENCNFEYTITKDDYIEAFENQ